VGGTDERGPAERRHEGDVTAVPRRATALGDAADQHTPRLTIGEVLAVLRDDFPDVTISKIRYLESEDLVHPQRTPSGYRKFSRADVSRLRYVLAAQRDQYLPLKVIKEHLEALDRGEPLPGTAAGPGSVPAPPSLVGPEAAEAPPLTPEQFARAAGLAADQLADCVQFGLLATDAEGNHPAADLPVARAAAGLARHGIEPRHLRVYRTGVEREAGLVEQLVSPVLRARSEEARTRATEKLRELAALSAQLHTALLETRLRELLRP
jgi:DNA-binding transcriptional MerR regulator